MTTWQLFRVICGALGVTLAAWVAFDKFRHKKTLGPNENAYLVVAVVVSLQGLVALIVPDNGSPAPNGAIATRQPSMTATSVVIAASSPREIPPTIEPRRTPFPASLAQDGPLKHTAVKLATDIIQDCTGELTDTLAEHIYYNALSKIVGRLKNAHADVSELTLVNVVPQSCDNLKQEAGAVNLAAQSLK